MQPDNLIASRYILERELGRGGTSVVWAARDSVRDVRVAIKMLRPELTHDPVVTRRFGLEGRALQKAASPHVVRVLDRDHDPVIGSFLVVEMLEGETLEQHLARVGAMDAGAFCRVARGIAEALGDIHALGLVHRDLKPSNVFLAKGRDARVQVKLLDFGTVKDLKGSSGHGLTGDGDLVGTPSRMSPEQVTGQPVDARSDMWAFAMVAFEALVGAPAIDGRMPPGQIVMAICLRRLPVPSQFHAGLQDGFDAWFAKSTELAPADRFRSVAEQMEALEHVLAPARGAARMRQGQVTIRVHDTLSLPPLVPRPVSPAARDQAGPRIRRSRQAFEAVIQSSVAADDKE